MHNKAMHMPKRCKPALLSKPRHRLTVAVRGDLWEKFQPSLKNEWQGSFTSWLEYAMECYTRDSCDGCPYQEEEGQVKAEEGIGKVYFSRPFPLKRDD
jgi:hypothetical protein